MMNRPDGTSVPVVPPPLGRPPAPPPPLTHTPPPPPTMRAPVQGQFPFTPPSVAPPNPTNTESSSYSSEQHCETRDAKLLPSSREFRRHSSKDEEDDRGDSRVAGENIETKASVKEREPIKELGKTTQKPAKVKMSFGGSGGLGKRTSTPASGGGIGMKLKPQSEPAAKKAKVELTPSKASTLASNVFGDDSDDEEEMPPEAKLRMRNIGKNTPTSAGPNSFNKSTKGFSDPRSWRDD